MVSQSQDRIRGFSRGSKAFADVKEMEEIKIALRIKSSKEERETKKKETMKKGNDEEHLREVTRQLQAISQLRSSAIEPSEDGSYVKELYGALNKVQTSLDRFDGNYNNAYCYMRGCVCISINYFPSNYLIMCNTKNIFALYFWSLKNSYNESIRDKF